MKNILLAALPLTIGFVIGRSIRTTGYDEQKGPPRWVFPVVWTVLYILLGYSAYRVGFGNDAIIFWWIGLLLNFLWTPVYFGNGDTLGGAMLIESLIVTTLVMTIAFYRVDHLAGMLQIPYLAWLVYARGLVQM